MNPKKHRAFRCADLHGALEIGVFGFSRVDIGIQLAPINAGLAFEFIEPSRFKDFGIRPSAQRRSWVAAARKRADIRSPAQRNVGNNDFRFRT
jgi:hypothetical protein